MKPTRYTTIRGHLVEEFRWLSSPVCYVDAHRVADCFDDAVADLQTAGRILPANLSQNAAGLTTAIGRR
jgi:hypothetical protein